MLCTLERSVIKYSICSRTKAKLFIYPSKKILYSKWTKTDKLRIKVKLLIVISFNYNN